MNENRNRDMHAKGRREENVNLKFSVKGNQTDL